MKLKPTQWYAPKQWGKDKSTLDGLFLMGRLQRRRVTEDGGETWAFYYRGEV